MTRAAGRVEEKVLSWLLAKREIEEPEANFLNAIEDAIVSEARNLGSPGCVRAKI